MKSGTVLALIRKKINSNEKNSFLSSIWVAESVNLYIDSPETNHAAILGVVNGRQRYRR